VLASFFLVHASALKALHKAGRRGGDSIAREGRWQACARRASAAQAS